MTMKWLTLKLLPCCLAIGLCLATAGHVHAQKTGGEKAVRATVQRFFSLLKTRQYQALYDFLPLQFQKQTTREQLTASLRRLDDFLVIEKMEVGRIQQRDDLAVVDTVIHGRLKRPVNVQGREIQQGRVSSQQYLIREEGKWKIATADNRSQQLFLQQHPEVKQYFQLTRPQWGVN